MWFLRLLTSDSEYRTNRGRRGSDLGGRGRCESGFALALPAIVENVCDGRTNQN